MPLREVDKTLDAAVNHLQGQVHTGSSLLEEYEHAGLFFGNGHHARQAVALYAAKELVRHWANEEEAKAYDKKVGWGIFPTYTPEGM